MVILKKLIKTAVSYIFAEINSIDVTGPARMAMMDLCYPYGDSALRDGGFQNLDPEPKSYF